MQYPGNGAIDMVMLIDDNDLDRYISQQIIERTGFSKRVKTFHSSVDAFGDLTANQFNMNEVPEFIFLDIYMPDSDAFTFISDFEKLSGAAKDKCKLVILSSSDHRAALSKIVHNKYVVDLFAKPMNPGMLMDLKNEFSYSDINALKMS